MKKTIICKNCCKQKPANPRLKGNQLYCSAPNCQRARKRAWQKQKMIQDSQYHEQQVACLKKWRKTYPLDKYQKEYRKKHPDYVKRNRDLQKKRNANQSKKAELIKIVKMDALKKQSEKLYTCVMNPYKIDSSGKIVKMDALIVQLADLHKNIDLFLSLRI